MDDDLKRIAARIRTWRDEAGLTLQQLGDQSSVSASTIHKIENMQTVPTIAVLLKVAAGLGRRPSELLAEADTEKPVGILRAHDRQKLDIQNRAQIEHLVEPVPRGRVDAWRVKLAPGAGPDSEAWRFQGEIIMLVEEGDLETEIAGETYKVGTGDSIHFDASAPHRWCASGGRHATLVVFALLPDRMQGDMMSRIALSMGARPVRTPAIETHEII